MRRDKIFFNGIIAGILEEREKGKSYRFLYNKYYTGDPISLTMPIKKRIYEFNNFPAFFEGLLPEGLQLEGLLRQMKIDKTDFFSQLITVGQDMVGAVTVEETEWIDVL